MRLGIRKSEPGAEVGFAGQKLACGARGAGEMRLSTEGAAAARPHRASPATGSSGAAAERAPEVRWPASCAALLRPERLEWSEPRGLVAPAAPVPWKRARRPPAPAPPERLKRQPRCHRGLDAPLGVPPPRAPSAPPPLHASAAEAGEAARTPNKWLRSILGLTLLQSLATPRSNTPHQTPPKMLKPPWLSPANTNLLRPKPAVHLPLAGSKRRRTFDSVFPLPAYIESESGELVRTRGWGRCV